MPHYTVTKQIYFTLCTVKCGLVSELVIQSKTIFVINEILNFGTAVVFQIFHPFIQKNAKNLAFF